MSERTLAILKKGFLVICALILFLALPMTWDNAPSDVRSPAVPLCLIGFGGLILIRALDPREAQLPKIMLPLGVFVLWLMALLPRTPVPFFGIGWIVQGFMLLLGFWLISETARQEFSHREWERLFILVGLLVVLVDFLLYFVWRLRWREISGSMFADMPINTRLFGVFIGHPNIYGAYLNMILPFVFVRLMKPRAKLSYGLWPAVFVLLLFTQYRIASRGAWLGLIAALPLMVILRFSDRIRTIAVNLLEKQGKRISWKTLMIGAGTLLSALLLTFAFWSRLQNSAHGTFSDRLAIWEYALQLIARSPLTGYGPGALQFLYALRKEGIGGDEVFHTHNLLLETWGTAGIVGLLILLWALLWSRRAFLRAWKAHPSGSTGRDTLTACAGIGAALAVHNQIDFLFEPFRFGLGALLAIALVYSLAPAGEQFPIRRRSALTLQLSLLGLILLGGWFSLRGGTLLGEGVLAFQRGERQAARDMICRAASQSPSNTLFAFQCSLSQAYNAWETGDPKALETARSIQIRTLNRDPYWYIHWANLASYEWELNQPDAALEHLQKAIDLAPKRGFLWQNLGWMHENLGNPARAAEAYRTVICLEPMQAFSPYFQQTEIRRLARKEAVSGNCPAQAQTLPGSPTMRALFEGRTALENGDLALAKSWFEKANLENPLDPTAYTYLGIIADRSGKPDQAGKQFQTAAFLFEENSFTLLQAGLFAKSQGQDALAADFLRRAYQISRYPDFSRVYFIWSYQLLGLPTDLSPFLIRRLLSPEEIEAYQFLSLWKAQQGDSREAEEIQDWVRRFSPAESSLPLALKPSSP